MKNYKSSLTQTKSLLLLFIILISLFHPGSASAANAGQAVQLNGTNQYVNFGNPASLNLPQFTIETWFRRAGTGVGVNTGTGGLVGAIPLVTKGRSEGDGPGLDINYFLGISSTGYLAADFEEGATANPGLNHPLVGTTAIQNNIWYHAAVTYDGSVFHLYLNGNLEASATVNRVPATDGTQNVAAGTTFSTAGTTAGYFAGQMDEVRIWNRGLSATEIQDNRFQELTSGSGLVARWGLNEGSGTTAANSVVGGAPGALVNNPAWVLGFLIPDAVAPLAPSGFSVEPFTGAASLAWNANTEPDLAGYNIYRATAPSVPLTGPLNGATPYTGTTFINTGLTNGTTYYYVVTALDTSGNESPASIEIAATPQASQGAAIRFDGVNDYVTFGNPSDLGLPQFTVETWFKRTGTGVTASTGATGVTAIPLVTKGVAENDASNVDVNYFLGIRPTDNVLVADFEQFAVCGGQPAGGNNPIIGSTAITSNVWHHAAVTYNGTHLRLYLDGFLQSEVAVSCAPRYDSIQPVALGTAINSTGTRFGFFDGVIDESRIWNYARTGIEIRDNRPLEIASAPGLVGRWGMSEGTGTTTANSAGATITGNLINGPYWVPGFVANVDNLPPAAPVNPQVISNEINITLAWNSNTEPDLFGYYVYRSTTSPVTTASTLLTAVPLGVPGYSDTTAVLGTRYYYAVSAVDTSGNESPLSVEVSAIPQLPPPGACALDLGGNQAYVNFGDPNKLDLSQFTLETWFMRTGAGQPGSTGSNGLPNAIPLLTHGTSQDDNSNLDANWILAIDNTTGALAADFEDSNNGTNHPVIGITPITYNTWHHAAATYDGNTWRLYLDGNLEATLVVGASPRADSIQQVGLGVMLQSNGTPIGRFRGVFDEARVWNVARSEAQILASINSEVTSAPGLVARWGFSECAGNTVVDSIAPPANGTITGTGSSWVPGAPFNLVVNQYPNQPTLVSPPNGATGVTTSPTLVANVTDPEGNNLTVSFYGRRRSAATTTPFSIVVLPDTQYYSQNAPGMFIAQTQWIVDNRIARNIAYVVHLGDVVQNGRLSPPPTYDFDRTEWDRANAAMSLLDGAGIPYGVGVGNHDYDQAGNGDSTTTAFNEYFGVSRFQGRPYYGGYYGSDNDNHYDLFTASGIDFVVIYIAFKEPSPSPAVLNWADSILKTYPNRVGIVMNHNLFPYVGLPNFSASGQAIYDELRDNNNLVMMLAGHVTNEVYRADTYNGHTIHSILSNYQEGNNYGDGWLRIMEFQPVNGQVAVSTYSPTRNEFQADFNSQFTIPLNMMGSYTLLGTTTVPSGSNASLVWNGLQDDAEYEWYAVASDARGSTQSVVHQFTTGSGNTPPVADDQAVTTDEDTPLAITLTASDINLNPLTYSIVTTPVNGLLSGTAPNITYTPNPNWFGADTFTFRANDGMDNSNTATVTVTVQSINDLPGFTSTPITTATEGTPYIYNISATDSDSVVLTISSASLPTWLTLTDNGNGTATLSGFPDNSAVGTHPITLQVSDGFANVSQTFNLVVGYGITPPSVTINQASGQTDPTNAATIYFTAAFTEDVTGFTGADVTLSGTAGATTAAVTPTTGNFYLIAVSGMTSSGTVIVSIPANVAVDLGGNGNLASVSTDNEVTYDAVGPVVTIGAPSAAITSSGPVSFPVTVTNANTVNLSVGDVTLNATGTATGTVTVTGGATATPTVTIFGISGDGTLGISMAAGVATDSLGNPSAAAGPSTTFTVDNTAPNVVSLTRANPSPTNAVSVNFDVTFSEPVDGLSAANFSLPAIGVGGASITGISGSGANYTVAVDTGAGDGTLGLNLVNSTGLSDAAGNVVSNIPFTGQAYTIEKLNPLVLSINRADPNPTTATSVTFTITFSKPVTGVSNANFSLESTGVSGAALVSVTGSSASYTAVASTGAGEGTVGLNLTNTAGIADLLGNPLGSAPFTGEFYTIDLTPPAVSANGIGSVPDTDDGSISELEIVLVNITKLLVKFNEDVNNPAGDSSPNDVTNPANYLLVQDNGDGIQTVSCSAGVIGGDLPVLIDSVVYDNSTFTATLNLGGGGLTNGVYRFIVCGTTSITDLAGNRLAGDGVNERTDFSRNFIMAVPGGNTGGGDSDSNSTIDLTGLTVPATGFAPNLVTPLALHPTAKAYSSYSGLVLEIPRLGIKLDIVGVPFTPKQGWDVTWLGKQAGYLQGSAFPTMAGNSVITAHVWDALNKPGPFSNLKNLSYGDKVIVRAWGQVFTYEVQTNSLVSPNNLKTVMKRESLSWVTLVTCETFNDKTSVYAYRRMVRAVLVSVVNEK